MRSRASDSGTRTGYEYASATQSRPRSSMAKVIGWTTSGSPAKRLTWKPVGTVIAAAASAGESPSWAKTSGEALVGRDGLAGGDDQRVTSSKFRWPQGPLERSTR